MNQSLQHFDKSGVGETDQTTGRSPSRTWRRLGVSLIAIMSVFAVSVPLASAHVHFHSGTNGCDYYSTHNAGATQGYDRARTMAINDNNTSGSLAKECRSVRAYLRYKSASGTYHNVYGAMTSGISSAQGPIASQYQYGKVKSLDWGAGAWSGWQWH